MLDQCSRFYRLFYIFAFTFEEALTSFDTSAYDVVNSPTSAIFAWVCLPTGCHQEYIVCRAQSCDSSTCILLLAPAMVDLSHPLVTFIAFLFPSHRMMFEFISHRYDTKGHGICASDLQQYAPFFATAGYQSLDEKICVFRRHNLFPCCTPYQETLPCTWVKLAHCIHQIQISTLLTL
mmetsp:Transcript_17403/g.42643  ORF Transcript_17403/g.42643 Transcript_17403/m.42643 type:complete len:178 (+) Transcript_17403:1154-1687(+)